MKKRELAIRAKWNLVELQELRGFGEGVRNDARMQSQVRPAWRAALHGESHFPSSFSWRVFLLVSRLEETAISDVHGTSVVVLRG